MLQEKGSLAKCPFGVEYEAFDWKTTGASTLLSVTSASGDCFLFGLSEAGSSEPG